MSATSCYVTLKNQKWTFGLFLIHYFNIIIIFINIVNIIVVIIIITVISDYHDHYYFVFRLVCSGDKIFRKNIS